MKKIIIFIVIIIVIIGSIYQIFFKRKESKLNLVEVARGNISQEVSETGTVKKGEKIELGFKNTGQIKEIYVETGEKVKRGDKLAKMDDSELQIQLKEKKAEMDLAQARLDKLIAGASKEDIQIAQSKVDNRQLDVDNAQRNLNGALEDALNVLDDVYLKSYNAYNVVLDIQKDYFNGSSQESIKVKTKKDVIENAKDEIKSFLDAAKSDPTDEKISLALSKTKADLEDINEGLKVIRETCDESVSSTDKTSLDNQRQYINTALSDVVDAEQSIESKKLALDLAQGNLQLAKNELAKLLAPARNEDIEVARAQLEQAKSQIKLLENKIYQSYLRSPVDGQVIKIDKRKGETVGATEKIITVMPDDPFDIEVNIYEEDVVKINVGNPVEISLVAFPEKKFQGRIVSIDPAGKLIEGVVYYKVTISSENLPNEVKPGMTADLVIKTASKENVLIISQDLIQKKEGKFIVQVLKDKNIESREIKIGLEGKDNIVEVVSGLKEGEKVIRP